MPKVKIIAVEFEGQDESLQSLIRSIASAAGFATVASVGPTLQSDPVPPLPPLPPEPAPEPEPEPAPESVPSVPSVASAPARTRRKSDVGPSEPFCFYEGKPVSAQEAAKIAGRKMAAVYSARLYARSHGRDAFTCGEASFTISPPDPHEARPRTSKTATAINPHVVGAAAPITHAGHHD